MPALNHTNLSDLRGAARLIVDAAAGIAGIAEKMHGTVQSRPGALGASAADRPGGITGLVYRCVHGGIRLTGQGIDAALAPLALLLQEGESSPAADAWRSAVNGLWGDHLLRTANPLAIEMSLRYRGEDVDPTDPKNVFAESGRAKQGARLLVLVHGLCMNDARWLREEHDHGAALADELEFVPLYLRYNTGLRIARNGRALAETLETLMANWPGPPEELVIIGHSMGGLVARSACHHARAAGHIWPQHLRKLVFLGTPHLGTPLERGGHALDVVLELSPYSSPFTRIGKSRSAGIADLRHGAVADGGQHVPLPSGVKCYAAAALATKRSGLSERLVGDGLVPLDSALGRHRDTTRTLGFPQGRQWTGYGMRHLDLLSRPEVYAQLRDWLRQPG